MVSGHLRIQNGIYQCIISYNDYNGKRKTKSISTGLVAKGNKKRAEEMLSELFFFLPADSVAGLWGMMVMQILISIFTGIISPLIWSMYADVSDYAELKFNTASTGLIFSSASMAQKFGGAIGGASVMWLLAAIGYIQPQAGEVVTQPAAVVQYLWYLMTFVPCCVALLSIIVVNFYPLTTEEIESIGKKLRMIRNQQ